MKAVEPRPISYQEAAVVRAALLKAPLGQVAGLVEQADALRVVAVCECGCRSVYFCSISAQDRRVADGVGFTSSGEHIDVMVWANSNGLSALDLVDYSGSGELPVVESICRFEELGRGEAKT